MGGPKEFGQEIRRLMAERPSDWTYEFNPMVRLLVDYLENFYEMILLRECRRGGDD